jgi:hypothetical protein
MPVGNVRRAQPGKRPVERPVPPTNSEAVVPSQDRGLLGCQVLAVVVRCMPEALAVRA